MFNRKKREKELKDKLKKEILKELNEEQNKSVPVVKPVKPPVLHHSDEELYEIRKNFLTIFLFSGVVLFIIIIIFIVNPFSGNKKKEPNIEGDSPIVEEKDDTLINREDGIIENTNVEMLELFNLLVPTVEEYFIYDSTYLYSKNELKVSDISSEYLLYLMTKSSNFKEIIHSTGKLTKLEICSNEGNIRIPIEEINNLIYELFNVTNIDYKDFTYTHYIDGVYSTYIEFKYSDGYYVAFCYDIEDGFKYKSIVRPVISEAHKSGEQIIMKTKVAFITEHKVYADYSLTKEIYNDPTADMLNYIKQADTYEYRYKLVDNKYKLESILKSS